MHYLYEIVTDFTVSLCRRRFVKTKQMTITELQNQLIAAQNHIEAIESEKTSDNNSIATVNEVSPEIVSKSERRLNTDVNYEGKSKSFDFFVSLKFVFVILLACITFAMGIYIFAEENDIEISIANISEQQTIDYEVTPIPENVSIPNPEQSEPQERQETEQEQSETNALQNSINFVLHFLPIIITIFVTKLAISFLMGVMRGT